MASGQSAEEYASSEGGKAAPSEKMSSNYGSGDRMEDDLTMSKENKTETHSSDEVAGREGIGTKMFDKLTGGKPGDGKVAKSTEPSDPGAGPTLPAGNPSGG